MPHSEPLASGRTEAGPAPASASARRPAWERGAGGVDGSTARALAAAVEGDVRLGRHDRLLYATDASIYQAEPLAVVVPTDREDAARALRFCRSRGLPVLPRAGGTSLAGQAVNRAVVIDTSAHLDRLLDVDPASRTCCAEAGVTLGVLNESLIGHGLHFAPDPSTFRQATVAGVIGNNAAGVHSILYGRTSENVRAVEAALCSGEIMTFGPGAAAGDERVRAVTRDVLGVVRRHERLIDERFPKTLRRSAGYQLDVVLGQARGLTDDEAFERMNLAPLLCGSEGTLALTLSAELMLHPLPASKGLAVISFESVEDAIDAVAPLLALKPAAIELLDDLVIDLARQNLEYARYVRLLPGGDSGGAGRIKAVLYVEFFSDEPGDGFGRSFDELRSMFGGERVQTHTDPGSMARAWKLRQAGEPLLHAMPGNRKPLGFIEDNAVPPARLGEFVRGCREIIESRGTRGSFYAHASVGVLHVRPLLDLRDPADVERMHEIASETADLAQRLGGVMSGEHGDGRARGPFLERFFGPELMSAFAEVKAAFDPGGLLNPGNIVPLEASGGGRPPLPTESISEGVRVRPHPPGHAQHNVTIPRIQTRFSYEDQTDFAHAVEMCNGAGVCRKRRGGVMCPSYMATLDERHSTRGRGNALRLAISGQTRVGGGGPDFDDTETLATLDLCLSCKACKSECPSNVDVARLKAEYLAKSYDARALGAPLPARVFASIHRLSELACVAPGVSNAFAGSRLGRALASRLLGIARRRSLPPFERPLHRRWAAELAADSASPVVLLYADTFTTFNEPGIGLAARRLLGAFGYRVELVRGDDAGRAAISVGMLDQAKRTARRGLSELGRWLDRFEHAPLLVLEPSVLSAMIDDWALLKLDEHAPTLRALRERASLVEDFLEARWDAHPRRPGFADSSGRVLFHGHCHQRALLGDASGRTLLERVAGDRVQSPDTTCCGLAGSFGYTEARFDISMAVGELGLLPAARGLRPEDAVVAAGTSCRHQIKDGAQRRALHPVEWLAEHLAERA